MNIIELKQLLHKHNIIPAIWRNKDFDVPVKVNGILGSDENGKNYISIEGSSSGIPFCEIIFKKNILDKLRNSANNKAIKNETP